MANGDMAGVENRLTAIADAITAGGGGGSGTVTDVSVVTANGVSGSVATSTTTPAITLTLGAISPSTVTIGAGSAITSSGAGGALGTAAFTAATAYEVAGAAAAVVSDTAYDATSWNGDTTHAPSKNAVRDKIESLSFPADDTPYDATTWNGSMLAPTQNSVRDKFETLRIGTDIQAYDAQLDTWAGVTPGTGVTTFLATPTLANFNTALSDADVATLTGTETLSGKTLTEPKFVDLGFIADANGNELLILDTVTSAVNELTLANAATGTNPTITASGADAAIGINYVTKSTGAHRFTGDVIFPTTNTYDLGTSASRPRNLFVGSDAAIGGSLSTTNNVTVGATKGFFVSGRSFLSSAADGVFKMANNANTDFSRLQLGGTTSSFPAIKRNAASIDFRLADDTADAAIKASVVESTATVRLKGYTVATLPAGTVGDTAYVTDATAPTYLGALTGGGAVTCPVFFNGSAWVSH